MRWEKSGGGGGGGKWKRVARYPGPSAFPRQITLVFIRDGCSLVQLTFHSNVANLFPKCAKFVGKFKSL